MKFLVFNIVVVACLWLLYESGRTPDSAKPPVQRVEKIDPEPYSEVLDARQPNAEATKQITRLEKTVEVLEANVNELTARVDRGEGELRSSEWTDEMPEDHVTPASSWPGPVDDASETLDLVEYSGEFPDTGNEWLSRAPSLDPEMQAVLDGPQMSRHERAVELMNQSLDLHKFSIQLPGD